jgi:hypothetical protein
MARDRQPVSQESAEFTRQAQLASPSFLGEVWALLRSTKKWWLAPIIVFLLILGVLITVGGSAAAPFIYTLF